MIFQTNTEHNEIEYSPKSFTPLKKDNGSTRLLDSEVYYTCHKKKIELGLERNPAVSDLFYNLCEDVYNMKEEEGMSFKDIQKQLQIQIKRK